MPRKWKKSLCYDCVHWYCFVVGERTDIKEYLGWMCSENASNELISRDEGCKYYQGEQL